MKRILVFMFVAGIFLMTVHGIDFPQIDGWKPIGNVKTYHPDNLHEYIIGASPQFLDYGFQELKCRDIERDQTIVSVQLYNMGTSLNAYGIYQAQHGSDITSLNIGARSTFTPSSCLLLKGQYYVKVDALQGELNQEIGVALLKSISAELHGQETLPREVAEIPLRNRLKDSDGFTAENFLGLSELKNCVHAEYNEYGRSYQMFRIVDNGITKADAIWNSLVKSWKSDDSGTIRYRQVPGKGLIGIKKADCTYIGITHCNNLKDMTSRLNGIS